jgi:hypothetical protein
MIDIRAAAELLDFGARIKNEQRAREQLEGAVAVHNLLLREGVAYLADEVGMGKTFVALGAMTLFRHFQPNFRALIIAPRENIQLKWMKELGNFVRHNVRFPDMRVKALDGRPVRPLVACNNLLDLVREVTLDRDRDFFLRLTSFSLPLKGRDEVDLGFASRLRDGLREHLPWLRNEVFDLRNKQAFKDNFARALCCALPVFDLVIVDEGHNLKHGFGENVSARNRVLGLAMGHPDSHADRKLFPGFGPRAKRVLFLSATPVEETYDHLWNQLDVVGRSSPYQELVATDLEEEEKKAVAGRFLIRRVTSIQIGGEEHTKNRYRREWRHGGVHVHDEPIHLADAKQRLVVGLVQKKVSELLGDARFNRSFQIGMLASFESFLETAKLKREDSDAGNFDDADQTDDLLQREGIDVASVNRLAADYRNKFGREMPHPKMDAVVDALTNSWKRGEKALVFVRRVASVKELKRKLDERYDDWLMERLRRDLPEAVQPRLEEVFERYRVEKKEALAKGRTGEKNGRTPDEADQGGKDTFFAWFFRGEGPQWVVSGANIQQRFKKGAAYAAFFEDNYVADLLGCRPGEVEAQLSEVLGVPTERLRSELRHRSRRFLSGAAKRHAAADRYEAVQAAAVEWLKDRPGPHQARAGIIWRERFQYSCPMPHASEAPEIGDWLELPTFFTELRQRPKLRDILWPAPSSDANQVEAFREQELRAQMLASAARLGHGLIDLYVMTIGRLNSMEPRAQEAEGDEPAGRVAGRIHEYLDLLERQKETPIGARDWGTFDELAEIARNFNLILDVNEPEARQQPIGEAAKAFGQLLGRQQPVGGMSGQVNRTLVRQFRMPGYPLVLITTDVLQEGEDLHTFCSSVHHYGISWTPSSMEQRIGRVDRVRSQTDRRLSDLAHGALKGEDKLQVYFPHLEDTVEVLQVQRVLERMNVFLRLMHEGLIMAGREKQTISTEEEFVRPRQDVPQIDECLRSAFPIREDQVKGDIEELAVGPEFARDLAERFARIKCSPLAGLNIRWEPSSPPGTLLGTACLGKRVQPFTLLLKSLGRDPLVRCISPVGRVSPHDDQESLVTRTAGTRAVKIGAIETDDECTYDLAVEGDVLLASTSETDAQRVAMLINRVVHQADSLEQECFQDQDAVLETFRDELLEEGNDGR